MKPQTVYERRRCESNSLRKAFGMESLGELACQPEYESVNTNSASYWEVEELVQAFGGVEDERTGFEESLAKEKLVPSFLYSGAGG